MVRNEKGQRHFPTYHSSWSDDEDEKRKTLLRVGRILDRNSNKMPKKNKNRKCQLMLCSNPPIPKLLGEGGKRLIESISVWQTINLVAFLSAVLFSVVRSIALLVISLML